MSLLSPLLSLPSEPVCVVTKICPLETSVGAMKNSSNIFLFPVGECGLAMEDPVSSFYVMKKSTPPAVPSPPPHPSSASIFFCVAIIEDRKKWRGPAAEKSVHFPRKGTIECKMFIDPDKVFGPGFLQTPDPLATFWEQTAVLFKIANLILFSTPLLRQYGCIPLNCIFIIYPHKKNKEETMQILVSKRGGKRSTWLIGSRKKGKKNISWLHHQSVPRERWQKGKVCYCS
jgi:hypothetical protein